MAGLFVRFPPFPSYKSRELPDYFRPPFIHPSRSPGPRSSLPTPHSSTQFLPTSRGRGLVTLHPNSSYPSPFSHFILKSIFHQELSPFHHHSSSPSPSSSSSAFTRGCVAHFYHLSSYIDTSHLHLISAQINPIHTAGIRYPGPASYPCDHLQVSALSVCEFIVVQRQE